MNKTRRQCPYCTGIANEGPGAHDPSCPALKGTQPKREFFYEELVHPYEGESSPTGKGQGVCSVPTCHHLKEVGCHNVHYESDSTRLFEGEPSCKGHCGWLGWTIQEFGQVTHKHSCPLRTDTFCQTHPKGCPPAVAPDRCASPMSLEMLADERFHGEACATKQMDGCTCGMTQNLAYVESEARRDISSDPVDDEWYQVFAGVKMKKSAMERQGYKFNDDGSVSRDISSDPFGYCIVHQSNKWCKHNGGVMGPTGYEAPRDISSDPVCSTCGKTTNEFCSNAFHLPRDISSVTGSAAETIIREYVDEIPDTMIAVGVKHRLEALVADIQRDAVDTERKRIMAILRGYDCDDMSDEELRALIEGKTDE